MQRKPKCVKLILTLLWLIGFELQKYKNVGYLPNDLHKRAVLYIFA
jgi:hypothetical protein